jgi:hypothetical protein
MQPRRLPHPAADVMLRAIDPMNRLEIDLLRLHLWFRG